MVEGKKLKKTKIELEEIFYAHPHRQHSKYPDMYWDHARNSVRIFAPTLWKSIMGIEKALSDEIKSMERSCSKFSNNFKLLLMDPGSDAFQIHLKYLLSTTGSVPHPELDDYYFKLGKFYNHITKLGGLVKFYQVYPTVSFVIVDNSKVKVDFVLPHRSVEKRPVIEFLNKRNKKDTIYKCFSYVFDKIWDDNDTIEVPSYKSENNKTWFPRKEGALNL